jgi:uncharacterized membrane protein YhaH (DUF805 family)
MTSDVLLVGSAAVVLAAVGASVLVGFEAGRMEQIAAAWADGCAQLATWWAVLAPRLHAARVAVWRWLLAQVLLPAHGTHRGEEAR